MVGVGRAVMFCLLRRIPDSIMVGVGRAVMFCLLRRIPDSIMVGVGRAVMFCLLHRIPDSISKDIEKRCQSIYPLHDVFIRKVKVLKKPKFDSKLVLIIALLM